MKDNMDILLENALRPNMEPSKELNAMLVEQASQRRTKTMKMKLYKAAAIAIAVVLGAPMCAYAANYVMDVLVTDHAVSVGNSEYVIDEAIADTEEEVTTEYIEHVEGDETVKWLVKDVQKLNASITNTYYQYADYETAISDTELDNWFSKTYEVAENVFYVVTDTGDTMTYSIDATFHYNEGQISVHQDIMTGNIAEDMAYSIKLQNTSNKRTYTSASGQVFTLVDEVVKQDGEEVTTTYVIIAYGQHRGSISFKGLTDEDIHAVLDTLTVKMETEEETTEEGTKASVAE